MPTPNPDEIPLPPPPDPRTEAYGNFLRLMEVVERLEAKPEIRALLGRLAAEEAGKGTKRAA